MPSRPSRTILGVLIVLPFLALPGSAEAQLGAVEAFARNVTDVSFYYMTGSLAGGSPELESGAFGLNAYGVELLFSVGEVDHARPRPQGSEPKARDSVKLVWKGRQVNHTNGGVDTVDTYEVSRIPPPPPPTDTVWYMEMGIGYGQLQGFDMAGSSMSLYGSVRDLPAVSLYVSYDPLGAYLGLRTGYMKTRGLQVVDHVGGGSFSGSADAFLFGAVLGESIELETISFFVEGGYTRRAFPSVEWSGPGPLPAGIPLDLNVSAWTISTGVQFSFR